MKTIICLRRRHALLILLVILSGCTLPPPPPLPQSPRATRPSFSCTSLTESYWRDFKFGVDSPDDVVATAASLWEIEREQVQFMLTISDEISSMWWRSDAIVGSGGVHEAWFQDDQKLAKINVEWGRPKPTLAQVIDCLGTPDHYIAFYDQGRPEYVYLSLALLYTDSGIVVRYFNPVFLFTPPTIYAGMQMDRFVVIAPGTAEQMVSVMYSYGVEIPVHVRSVCLMKPWPGSIEAMETATKEEKIRCGVMP